ncbi:MAG: fructose-bisphosphate aldolase class [Massilia sp.]|nr:fructose-bisphosphate aldolase class [Massilia sp.]
MNDEELAAIVQRMTSGCKGILAIDESIATCNSRFAALGIAPSVAMRRAYRDLLVTAPGLHDHIAAVILSDETIGQATADGLPFAEALASRDIVAGIKVDIGLTPFAADGELVTQGLDGLAARLAAYRLQGAQFAKWRAVLCIDDALPTRACIAANAHALARFAALCQEAGVVPVVEPEILMVGDHSLLVCAAVTEHVLRLVFEQLVEQRVSLEAIILKIAMVLPGEDCPQQATPALVAESTLRSLRRAVPAAVGAVAFLSGGQSPLAATERLAAMHDGARPRPWPLTFSFGRALQAPALAHWRGRHDHAASAQAILVHRAACNGAARAGAYNAAIEHDRNPS